MSIFRKINGVFTAVAVATAALVSAPKAAEAGLVDVSVGGHFKSDATAAFANKPYSFTLRYDTDMPDLYLEDPTYGEYGDAYLGGYLSINNGQFTASVPSAVTVTLNDLGPSDIVSFASLGFDNVNFGARSLLSVDMGFIGPNTILSDDALMTALNAMQFEFPKPQQFFVTTQIPGIGQVSEEGRIETLTVTPVVPEPKTLAYLACGGLILFPLKKGRLCQALGTAVDDGSVSSGGSSSSGPGGVMQAPGAPGGSFEGSDSLSVSRRDLESVPEPATAFLMLWPGMGLVLARKRRPGAQHVASSSPALTNG